MPISVKGLHTLFAAEICGLDLRAALDQPILREIIQALDHYAVLVFRNQSLTDHEQIAFSSSFGTLETAVGSIPRQPQIPPGESAACRRLESGREQQHPLRVRFLAPNAACEPTLAYRQFIQESAWHAVVSVRARIATDRWRDGICRSASSL